MDSLPYDFDLLYDIKTKAQLQHEIRLLESRLRGLRVLAIEHDIQLTDEGETDED